MRRRAPSRRAELTRGRILRTAEALFAEEGVDRVTLRRIARAAGQSNVSAVQYHFGDKEALLDAILEEHLDEIDDRRREMLDALDGPQDLPALVHVLVDPLVEKLGDPSGRAYLRIQADRMPDRIEKPATTTLARRIQGATGRKARRDPTDRFAVLLLFSAMADRARVVEEGARSARGNADFAGALVDALTRLLRAA